MFKFVKCLLGAGLIAGSTTVAAAGDLPPEVLDSVMASCRPDYHRLCSFVVPGDGRVGRCLLDREMELAPSCLKSIKLAYAMEACMPDYRRFCNGVQPGGGQIVECLASRIEALAPECQRVVSANAPYATPGHERYSSYHGPYSGPVTNPEAYRYEPSPSETAPYPGGGGGTGHLTMTVTPTAAMTAALDNPMATGATPTKVTAIRDTRNLDRDTSSPKAAIRRPKKDPRSNKHRLRRSAPVSGLIYRC